MDEIKLQWASRIVTERFSLALVEALWALFLAQLALNAASLAQLKRS